MMEQSEQAHSHVTGTDRDDCSPVPPLRLTPDDGLGSQSQTVPQPRRKTVELAPSRAFDPSKEEVLRWAITVAHTHRRFHRDFIAIRLASVAGKMAYLLDADPSVMDRLTPRLPSGLTVREPPTAPPLALSASATARVTLPSGLRDVPEDPDILGDFARVFADVGEDEYAELVITFASADKPSAKEPFRLPKVDVEKVLRDLHHHATTDPLARSVAPAKPAVTPAPTKAVSPPVDPGLFFRVVLASHAFSESPTRARELALAVVEPFHAWAPSGAVRVTSRSSSPEALTATRYPRGRACSVVPESVVAGLLLPPTSSCTATNVRRTAASAPVPPGLVPLGAGVFPLGTPDGYAEPVGLPVEPVLFAASLGRSGFGKSSQAMSEFLSLTLPPRNNPDGLCDGGVFIDPHRDAVQVLGDFYWRCPERVLRIDLGRPWAGLRLPVYNPLDAAGCSDEEAERRVSAVVGGFIAATGWNPQRASRAMALITESARLLVAVARGLPDGPAPTIFQIPRVLTDDTWRENLLSDEQISQGMQTWWHNEFTRGPKDAPLPVTQLIGRLRASRPVAALLGGSSTFSFREVMDHREVVLYAGLLSGDDKDRLATSLFVRALMQAAYSRSDVPEEERDTRCPRCWVYGDEAPTWDGPDLAKYFQELRKFRVRAKIMAQTPKKLSAGTWEAAVTNASIITSTAVDGDGAAMVSKLWRGPGTADMPEIEQFHHLVSATIDGKRSEAFLVKGLQPQDLFESRPGVLEAHIATDPRYRDVAEVVNELNTLDDRLMRAWKGERARGGTVSVGA